MLIFYVLLAVYLLSIVSTYCLTRYMYVHKIPMNLAQVWSWIVPVVNTMVTIVGVLLCWNYFPVCGLPFWTKRWDTPVSSLDKIGEVFKYKSICTEETV